ncbi:MAG: RHS repeat-associated core domain-containing protein [Terracidiphilus sp.]
MLPTGKVLVFGGVGDQRVASSHGELFDPVKQISVDIALTGLTPRSHHTATLLTDGRVLVAGGLNTQGAAVREIQVWDNRTGLATTLAVSLNAPRIGHSATLLADGTVLLSGGQDENGNPLNYGEIIDPSAPNVRFVSKLLNPLTATEPPFLAATIPQNGESGLPTDEIISLRFSKPLEVTSVNTTTVKLKTSAGDPVITTVVPAEGGTLAFITPQTLLQNGMTYTLTVSGATDSGHEPLADTTIEFTTELDEEFGGTTSGGGSSGSAPGNGGWPSEGGTSIASSGPNSQFRKLPMLPAPEGETALAGQVLKLDGSPLANVLLEIGPEHTSTDDTGRFLLRNLGPGHHIMLVDGGPATSNSNTYGTYRIGVDLKAETTNSLNYVIWMTALDTQHVVEIPSPTTSDLVITNPGVPGVELHIPAGTIIHDARGKLVTQIGITPIPTKQPPFPLKRGAVFPVYFTIQPGGATFSSPGILASTLSSTTRPRGATIHYENRYKEKPGVHFAFWNYDPAQKGWYVYGHGQVTDDAKMIVPDANTQIFSFDGAMVSLPGNAPPFGPIPGNPIGADPVDLQTGLFVYRKTDFELQDVIPLKLTRTYRQADYELRAFGIGMTMDYDIFLVGDAQDTPQGYTYQDLILADGGRIHFTRTSPCTGVGGYCDYSNAVYTATSTPGPFYGAVLYYVYDYWTIITKDGTFYRFPDSDDANNPRQAALVGMTDRYGNSLTFTRVNANLTQITSPNGRFLSFAYDSNNRVISVTDNMSRTTSYTYNPAGYLATATDANGGVTTYNYDLSGNMLSIQDPRGIVYLQNQYDVNDMVSQQTLVNGGIYQFTYSLDSNYNAVQTNVTDPRRYQRIVTFNSDGHMTGDTRAVGTPEVQAVAYEVQDGTGLVLSMTDALNRQTAFTYDSMANVTSITSLSSTSNAATTWFTYDPTYQELSSVTDPIGNETSFAHDTSGNLITATDPLGNTTAFSYNSAGQPVTITDPQGAETQLAYSAGILTSTTDPLGRTATGTLDGAGRMIGITDPLGYTYQQAYDPLDEVTAITDPLSNQTSFTYDGNGNRLTVTDANKHTTSYTYNNMDRVQTRQDPLGNSDGFLYDLNGNLTQVTDRKGQVTTSVYDGQNRPTIVTYNDGSTTANTYDAGNRLTTVADSISGTISRSYDGLDRVLSETTQQGSVGYTYDADGRRQTMTVSGQSQVNYTFDNASRLTSITQGSSNVSFVYDSDGRRTSLTLPNGVTASYSYDVASQLTGIIYQGGALGIANLTYGYDLAGRRTSVGGSLASTQLPAAVSSAVYNANNQLTQWGSTAMTYDLNGNTLNDGMNGYSWDARNRLVSANSNTATFSYDPLGRRTGRNILEVNTNFLYDGVNPVQELNGSTVTANLLTGGVDERFLRTTASETDNYLTDALGSTTGLTGSSGNSTVQYSYSPFGSISITGTTSNSYTYTGREIDGLGIDYYRARYYNPSLGRFLSEDPAEFIDGPNLYTYAGDDPLSFVDPLGTDKCAGNQSGGNGNVLSPRALSLIKAGSDVGLSFVSTASNLAQGKLYGAYSSTMGMMAADAKLYGVIENTEQSREAGEVTSQLFNSLSTASGITTAALTNDLGKADLASDAEGAVLAFKDVTNFGKSGKLLDSSGQGADLAQGIEHVLERAQKLMGGGQCPR